MSIMQVQPSKARIITRRPDSVVTIHPAASVIIPSRHYTCIRLSAAQRLYTLSQDLSSVVYIAIADVAQQRAVPIGTRQGRAILYRHSTLVALHTRHAEQLAAGEHSTVMQALKAVASQA